ncbi:PD-(D/E)XK nuclease family protein, partial [Patescibacteria group bacterium]|nr:PD-(D/E)XK nuclease family protein [Patescibacteria group bacterium]
KDPSKFLGRPKYPGYKDKDGETLVVFTNQQCHLKDGYLILPKTLKLSPIKTRLKDKVKLRQVRIIPKGEGYICEIVYKKRFEPNKTQKHENIGTTAVGGEVYTVRGVIDRIDEEDGKLKIVDYKTGSPKDKLTFNEKEQLLIYQMAVSEIFRQEISSLAFYYLNNNSEVEFLGTDEELDKTKDKILNIIKDIKKGEFPAKPSQLCKFCDFYSICEFRKS